MQYHLARIMITSYLLSKRQLVYLTGESQLLVINNILINSFVSCGKSFIDSGVVDLNLHLKEVI